MIHPVRIILSLFRVAAILTLLVAPMALMSAVNAGTQATIEAPTQAKKGLGLVLLVSLQR